MSDSEIDMEVSEEVKEIKSLMSEEGKKRIRTARIALKHKTKRDVAKTVAANNILRRKIGKRISRVIKQHPTIGKDIEDFVKSKRIGADAWRRTGVLTFDGSRTRGKKLLIKHTRAPSRKVWLQDWLWHNCTIVCHSK